MDKLKYELVIHIGDEVHEADLWAGDLLEALREALAPIPAIDLDHVSEIEVVAHL